MNDKTKTATCGACEGAPPDAPKGLLTGGSVAAGPPCHNEHVAEDEAACDWFRPRKYESVIKPGMLWNTETGEVGYFCWDCKAPSDVEHVCTNADGHVMCLCDECLPPEHGEKQTLSSKDMEYAKDVVKRLKNAPPLKELDLMKLREAGKKHFEYPDSQWKRVLPTERKLWAGPVPEDADPQGPSDMRGNHVRIGYVDKYGRQCTHLMHVSSYRLLFGGEDE